MTKQIHLLEFLPLFVNFFVILTNHQRATQVFNRTFFYYTSLTCFEYFILCFHHYTFTVNECFNIVCYIPRKAHHATNNCRKKLYFKESKILIQQE